MRPREVSSGDTELTVEVDERPELGADQEGEQRERDRHGDGVHDGTRQTARSTRVPLHASHATHLAPSQAGPNPLNG